MTSARIQPYAELCVTSNFTFLHGASHPEELVKVRKRLDLARDAERAIDAVPGRIVAGWV